MDVCGADVVGPSLQAEVVGRMAVLLAGQVELQVLLTELRAQERSEHGNTG